MRATVIAPGGSASSGRGVRLGWLAQTGLRSPRSPRPMAFPGGTWAGSSISSSGLLLGVLDLGRKPRYRLLGLLGSCRSRCCSSPSHMRRAGSGIPVNRGTDGLPGRPRRPGARRVRRFALLRRWLVFAPGRSGCSSTAAARSCASASRLSRGSDELAALTVLVAPPVLTLGMAAGFARSGDSSDLDLLIGLTLVTWPVYGAYLALRYWAGWRGRRAAYLVLVGVFARHRPPTWPPGPPPFRMSVVLVGTPHRLAPVEVRERVALDREAPESCPSARSRGGRGRVPLDLQPHGGLRRARRPRRGRSLRRRGVVGHPELYRLRDDVAAPVPGGGRPRLARARRGRDPGQAGSTKTASPTRARSPLSPGPACGEERRAETAIAESPSSVSLAAAALAQQVFGGPR